MKVCLRVANAVNAQIVLDEPGAESLFGKGDLLCDFGNGLVRAPIGSAGQPTQKGLSEVHDHLTTTELSPGFVFDGERIPTAQSE